MNYAINKIKTTWDVARCTFQHLTKNNKHLHFNIKLRLSSLILVFVSFWIDHKTFLSSPSQLWFIFLYLFFICWVAMLSPICDFFVLYHIEINLLMLANIEKRIMMNQNKLTMLIGQKQPFTYNRVMLWYISTSTSLATPNVSVIATSPTSSKNNMNSSSTWCYIFGG